MMCESARALPGGSTALLDVDDARLRRCTTTPSSSSCRLPASTTSAWCAVSDRKKSMTPKNSSFSSASRVKFGVGQRDQRVEADRKQRLDLAAVDRVHDLHARCSPACGSLVGRDAPDLGDVLARRRIGDGPLAGQLIALLAVLAAALAVALAGDHDAAGAFAADVAGGEAEVDHRQAVLDALGVVLDARARACSIARSRCRRTSAPPSRSPPAARRSLRRRAAGPTAATDSATASKPVVCAAMNSRSSRPSRRITCSMPMQQRQVRAGPHRQVEVGVARDRRHARVDDDQLAAVVAARARGSRW